MSTDAKLSTLHPALYRTFMSYAIICIALGLNFIFLHPAFPAAVPPKALTGTIFLMYGISEIVLLNFYRNLRLLRLVMAVIIGSMVFYALILTFAYFQFHQTSLQLPITYAGLALIGLPLLVEPFTNPVTDKNGTGFNAEADRGEAE